MCVYVCVCARARVHICKVAALAAAEKRAVDEEGKAGETEVLERDAQKMAAPDAQDMAKQGVPSNAPKAAPAQALMRQAAAQDKPIGDAAMIGHVGIGAEEKVLVAQPHTPALQDKAMEDRANADGDKTKAQMDALGAAVHGATKKREQEAGLFMCVVCRYLQAH